MDPLLDALKASIAEQMRLQEILKAGGDPRFGGTLPLGGKPHAWGTKGPAGPVNPWFPVTNPAESQGYDAFMNIIESRLEDEQRHAQLLRQRRR